MSGFFWNIFIDFQIIQLTFSSLSLIACTLVIIMYIKIKTLHVEAFKIIIMLISLDAIWSALIILSDSLYFANQPPVTICFIIYVFQIQSGLLSLFCTSKIAIDLYLSTFSKPEYFNKYVIGSLTLFAIIMGIMPAIFYDDAFNFLDTNYCYIQPLWALCLFFIPMALCLLLNSIFMIMTFLNLKKITDNKAANKYLARLFIYPIITIIVFVPPTIQEIYIYVTKTQDSDNIPSISLAIICSILQSSIGLIDSLAYCITAIKNQLSFLATQESTLEINLSKTDLQNMNN